RARPELVLGTATGNTTVGLHEHLVRAHQEKEAHFSRVALFQIDEYVGLAAEDRRSCRGRIQTQLSRPLSLDEARVFFPAASRIEEVDEAASRFEQTIQERGGLDLQILGIGLNGHIGFNEPGSPFGSLTRGVPISAANIHAFENAEAPPTHGITMGIRT